MDEKEGEREKEEEEKGMPAMDERINRIGGKREEGEDEEMYIIIMWKVKNACCK